MGLAEELSLVLIITAAWVYLVAGLVAMVAMTPEQIDETGRPAEANVYSCDWLVWPLTLARWYRARRRTRFVPLDDKEAT